MKVAADEYPRIGKTYPQRTTDNGPFRRLRLRTVWRYCVANFFLDNEDIQFLFSHIDLAELARLQEDDFEHAGGDRRRLRPRWTRPTPWTTTAASSPSSARSAAT